MFKDLKTVQCDIIPELSVGSPSNFEVVKTWTSRICGSPTNSKSISPISFKSSDFKLDSSKSSLQKQRINFHQKTWQFNEIKPKLKL